MPEAKEKLKLDKSKIAHFTESAMIVGGRALSMLFMTRCPVEDEFKRVDAFLEEINKFREMFHLEPLSPELIFTGERPKAKGQIGFKYTLEVKGSE